MTKTQQLIQQHFSALQPEFDLVMAPFTYMKIGGPAEVFIKTTTAQQAIDVVRFCHTNQLQLHVIGGASNVVVSSYGLKGVVLRIDDENYSKNSSLVLTGAGAKTGPFVRKTIDDGLQGLEYFLGVPGRLSGAVFNNAHYLADLIGKHVSRVHIVTRSGEEKWMTHDDCKFAYDYSIFHDTKDIILEIEFRLQPGDKTKSMELVKEATLYRAKTQPLGEPSSGCFFRNSPNTPELKVRFPQFADRREFPTAFLIDQLGLKGEQVGPIQISDKHAAFLINTGNGTSDQVKEMVKMIKERVKAEFAVQLKEEVFFLE